MTVKRRPTVATIDEDMVAVGAGIRCGQHGAFAGCENGDVPGDGEVDAAVDEPIPAWSAVAIGDANPVHEREREPAAAIDSLGDHRCGTGGRATAPSLSRAIVGLPGTGVSAPAARDGDGPPGSVVRDTDVEVEEES